MNEKERIQRRKDNKKWRSRYPEKVRNMRLRYLDRRFLKNPLLMDGLKGKLLGDFERLTRLMFDSVLPSECFICGSREDLQIHHMRYVYPVMEKDIMRLCARCHRLEHQKEHPLIREE